MKNVLIALAVFFLVGCASTAQLTVEQCGAQRQRLLERERVLQDNKLEIVGHSGVSFTGSVKYSMFPQSMAIREFNRKVDELADDVEYHNNQCYPQS